ncbi:MAG TPA: SDR family NAD(P)-dependent oxidoreductase [Candidatus Acidoferrales bacterium]|nr:SDR family NAD(P)-dependent oxidoreductase [Candidatus Acidoferrales bacterium]
MSLNGKVAIVTGGGRGIGRAIARRFASEGAAVVITARTRAQLESTAKEIESAGGRAAWIAADVSREEDAARIVEAARKTFGGVDILVNNAGIYGPVKPIEEITASDWESVMAANLRGAFLMTRAALPAMYGRGGGAILNISSVAARAAIPWGAAYATSKAGLLGLTRTTAAEGAQHGVRANAVLPGPVPETDMSQELGAALSARTGIDGAVMFKDFLKGILQGRPQTTAEIAAAALFLVSDQASAITGQSLSVDGGMSFC